MIQLTARELEVLQLIANGFTHAEIAERLQLTERAVGNAADRARMRLGAHSAPHAVLLAVRAGILEGRPKRRPGPARQPLTARQAEVLDAASDGASLSTVAQRLGTTTQQISARLSEGYLRLGVTHLPRDQRRAAAVDVARRRGLIPADRQEQAA
ncbi:LuxR C-terminal-related transcriptional regulator [Streptomyces sp. NBC_00006]|uniref:helix-turn-helix domain-containing protein n=1 Tax=Streptomyces sp. NBC_00006 TaxID=2975619 RepID=UPI0022567FE0|nr:LuxR C-terminal-related transcriptional regulator [Streptomyces sp. NBC_00006]MCX5528979.1 LuxR C-terminal-related transcriptional regulator [Streptomyces sp. NBC_00006]MCX5537789.1 LuxR C-terminal-related transcriptional regulator [Streptomyces sp. NBC_00006]